MPNGSSASSRIMSAPRSMPAARASRPSCRKAASGSKGWCRRWWRRRASPSAARRSRCSPSTTMSSPGSCPARRPSCCARAVRDAQEHPGRRRHLDRQDDAGQRPPRGGRQDRRPGGADRGHARAAMRRAEPRRAAHQGRRGHAVRSRALGAAPAPRPHSDRRGARRRSARPAQGLGHRPSRRRRHLARRLRASARCAASSSSSRKPSSPSRAR